MRNIVIKSIVLGFLMAAPARAATNVIDFNTDPAATGLYKEPAGGSAVSWRSSGGASGAANDGYLSINDALGSQYGILVFKDLEPGLVVKAFSFDCDLRIGGGRDRPADGMSLNLVSADDPIVSDVESGTGNGGAYFSGTTGEGSLPEEGGKTGLGIGFDTWQSGTIDSTLSGAVVQDVVGISIRVDGKLIAQLPLPLKPGNIYRPGDPFLPPGSTGTNYVYDVDQGTGISPNMNLATNDPNYNFSMQTGAQNNTDDLNGDGVVDAADHDAPQPADPTDPTWPLWIKNLGWAHFRAELSETGEVKIFWKGVELTPAGGLATGFAPRPGRLVFAGRTGGSWEVMHVDNIKLITIPADTVIIGAAVGNPLGFKITVIDSGPAIADTNTVAMKLNGATVVPTAISKSGGTTTFFYQGPVNSPIPIGSTNTVSMSIKDTRGIAVSNDRSFIEGPYSIVPAAYAVTGVDTTKPGFLIHPYQTIEANPNSLFWTDDQLDGVHGPNVADLTAATLGVGGIATTGYAPRDTVINFSIDGNADGTIDAAGNFNDANGHPDEQLPGVPGPTVSGAADPTANSTEETFTWLFFPAAGAYQMGVNSDDGFRVSTGYNPKDAFTLVLGQFNGGRGASDTIFDFVVNQSGYYPVRLLWENGGGGANVEWFTVKPDGTKVLVNDTATAGAILAYRGAPALPAYVDRVAPEPGSTAARPDLVSAVLKDGSTTIDAANVTLTLDGTTSATGTKSGSTTTVSIPLSAALASGSTHTAKLIWKDSGALAGTNTWTFTVATYQTLPTDLVSPIGSGDATKPGFVVTANQVDNTAPLGNTPNNNEATESQLAGLYGPNVADLSGASGGVFNITTYINWDRTANDGTTGEDGNFRAAGGYPEQPLPGIPGSGGIFENVAEGIQTYVEFPTAGFYQIGVNSDDNFRLTLAEAPPPAVLKISGPTNTALPCLSMNLPAKEVTGGRAAYGVAPPVPALSAPIVYMTPGGINDPGPYPDVTGKIALLDRSGSSLGTTSTGGKCKAAQTAGAVGVIFTTPGDGSYGFYAGATRTDINIPVLSVPDATTANLLRSYLTNNVAVTGTITGDSSYLIGGFNDGRGASDTIMNFIVPQAGVYPMRLTFHQGGGGGNCEFFSVLPTGTKVLVNDTAKGGLKAYRARNFVAQPTFNNPTISGGTITITWTGSGTLQEASALTGQAGDWTNVAGNPGSGYQVPVGTTGNKYYRLKQ